MAATDLSEPFLDDNLQEGAIVFEDSRRKRANGIGKAAWILEDALAGNLVEDYPRDQEARKLFFQSAKASKCYIRCILAMFFLSMFETPTWCTPASDEPGFWTYEADLCLNAMDKNNRGPGIPEKSQWFGHEEEDKEKKEEALKYMFSGVPYLPPGWGIVIEACLLFFMAKKLYMDWKMQKTHFDKLSPSGEPPVMYYNLNRVKVCAFMVAVEYIDMLVYIFVRNQFRLIWLSRFTYMICVPSVGCLLIAIKGLIMEFAAIAIFYVIGIVLFAWIATMIFQDMGKKPKNPYFYVFHGNESHWPNQGKMFLDDGNSTERFDAIFEGEKRWVNQTEFFPDEKEAIHWKNYAVNAGFDNIVVSLVSMFIAGATDDFYEKFRNTYSRHRFYGIVWLIFLLIVHVLLLSLVLDTLVDSYTKHNEDKEEKDKKGKVKGMIQAFKELTDTCAAPGKRERGLSNRIVKEKDFIDFALEYGKSPNNRPLSKEQAECLFKAVARKKDCARSCQGGEQGLLLRGFIECGGLMRFNIWFTIKDSPVKEQFPSLWSANWFQKLYDCTQEPKDGESPLNKAMNSVLMVNLALVVIEMLFELSGQEQEENSFGVPNLELMFSFIYLLEVGIKLCVWSWEEYFSSGTNHFDFIATILLLGSSIAGEFDDSGSSDGSSGGSSQSSAGQIKKILNMLRLLRLVRVIKQLKQYPAVQFMLGTIFKLVVQAQSILALLLVVIYFFTTLGVQLFGGLLWKGREDIEETEWNEEKYYVLNFNDFLNSFGCWVVMLLTEYKHGFTQAIMITGPRGCQAVFFVFYLFSVAIIFELVKAYTIEVFVDLHKENAEEKAEYKSAKADRDKKRKLHHIFLEGDKESKKEKKESLTMWAKIAEYFKGEDEEKELGKELKLLDEKLNELNLVNLSAETKEMLQNQIAAIQELQEAKKDPLLELREEFQEQQGKSLHTNSDNDRKEMEEILEQMEGVKDVEKGEKGEKVKVFELTSGEKVKIIDFDLVEDKQKEHGEAEVENEEEEPIFSWLVQSLSTGKQWYVAEDEFKHPPGSHGHGEGHH